MKQKSHKKSNKWFIKVRGSYLPNNGAGWLTYVPYLVYLVGVPVLAFSEHYGLVTTVLVVLPNWVAAVAVMNWVAANHS